MPIPFVTVVHEGMPCDPPVVEGHEFKPFVDHYWGAKMTEEEAQPFLRVSGYRLYGGAEPPAPEPEPEPEAPVEAEPAPEAAPAPAPEPEVAPTEEPAAEAAPEPEAPVSKPKRNQR